MPRPHYYTNGKAFTGTSTVSADNLCEVYITYQTSSSKNGVSTCRPTHTSYRLTHKLHTTHHVATRAVQHALTDFGLATANVASPSLNVVWSRYRCCWPLVQHLNTGDGRDLSSVAGTGTTQSIARESTNTASEDFIHVHSVLNTVTATV